MAETRTALDVRSATATKQLVIERTLKASPERVFDAFTDPEQLKPGLTRQTLTEQAAGEFARLAQRLRDRGHPSQMVAHFTVA